MVSQARSLDPSVNAIYQVVRRPFEDDSVDTSGKYAVIVTRYAFARNQDVALDNSNGEVMDLGFASWRLQARLDRVPSLTPRSYSPQGAGANPLNTSLANREDFRHGVPPERLSNPCLDLNLTTYLEKIRRQYMS